MSQSSSDSSWYFHVVRSTGHGQIREYTFFHEHVYQSFFPFSLVPNSSGNHAVTARNWERQQQQVLIILFCGNIMYSFLSYLWGINHRQTSGWRDEYFYCNTAVYILLNLDELMCLGDFSFNVSFYWFGNWESWLEKYVNTFTGFWDCLTNPFAISISKISSRQI